jgi:hypothetical protein
MKKWLVYLLFVPTMARAEFWTGNDVFQKQSSTEVMERMQALGYIMGIYDAYVHVHFCPKSESGITAGQVNDIVRQYLVLNPARRNQQGYTLVREAFAQVWPCANRTSRNPV